MAINESCLVEADPFASASSGRFELAAGSVGIDAAMFQDWMADAGDLAGAARVSGNGPDIGAYGADASAFGASFAADPSEGFGPLAVTLAVTPANAGAAGVVCEWFFDNEATPSETSSDLTLEKVFAIGTHTVRLRVTDIASAMQYEVPGYLTITSAPRVMYVAPNGSANTPEVPFATPETAAANVKDAVDAALPGAEIVLLRGLHNPPSDSVVYINSQSSSAAGRPVLRRLRLSHWVMPAASSASATPAPSSKTSQSAARRTAQGTARPPSASISAPAAVWSRTASSGTPRPPSEAPPARRPSWTVPAFCRTA